MNWHDTVRKMCVDSTWPEMAAAIKSQFPHKTDKQLVDMIRVYLRDKPEYQERKKRTQGNPKYDDKASVTYAGDGTIVSTKFLKLRDGEKLSHKDLLELHGLDSGQWEIVTATNNYWNSQQTNGGLQISFQSKITARPIKNALDFEAIDRHFAALKPRYTPPQRVYNPGPTLAVVQTVDVHLAKLAWRGDTGNDYDLKIARDMFYGIINEICLELRRHKIERIIWPWAQDFFNADNDQQTTTKGTPQDVDGRWAKMFNTGCDMLVDGAAMLAEIAPVDTFYTRSNHDELTSYAALQYLRAHYRNDSAITVDKDVFPRKYRLYGTTLLGFLHGDTEGKENKGTEKASRLASVMPNEAPELWGRSKYHEIHAAHLHSEQTTEEINGVIVRRLSSPTALDSYHIRAGFVGAVRKAQTFLYDKERGLVHIINTPV